MDKRGRKGYRDRLTLVCPTCGVTFTIAPSLINGRVRYCSLKCYHEAKRKGASLPEQSGDRNPNWKGGASRVERQCGVCGAGFVSAQARGRRYCSVECNAAAKRKERVERVCEICGKEFQALQSDVARGRSRFCSPECSGVHYSKTYFGENHHNHGVEFTLEHRKHMRAALYKSRFGIDEPPDVSPTQKDRKNWLFYQWRRDVLRNDNHACVRCGRTTGLHAHHIEPFCVFPENGTNPDNGITLCATCHKVVHSSDFLADIQSNAVGCSIRGDFAGIY